MNSDCEFHVLKRLVRDPCTGPTVCTFPIRMHLLDGQVQDMCQNLIKVSRSFEFYSTLPHEIL